MYLVRHGEADALGQLTDVGRDQCRRLAGRFAGVPLDVIWHSPLPRAVESAASIADLLPRPLLDEAPELVDHVPFVPQPEDRSGAWTGFFDGYTAAEAAAGLQAARALTARFARPPSPGQRSTHELLVTHAYPVAWLLREFLGAPPAAWLSLSAIANTGVSVVELAQEEPPIVRCVNERSHLQLAAATGGRP
nr:histidine phosphatase family protein [Kineosphaera limosa]